MVSPPIRLPGAAYPGQQRLLNLLGAPGVTKVAVKQALPATGIEPDQLYALQHDAYVDIRDTWVKTIPTDTWYRGRYSDSIDVHKWAPDDHIVLLPKGAAWAAHPQNVLLRHLATLSNPTMRLDVAMRLIGQFGDPREGVDLASETGLVQLIHAETGREVPQYARVNSQVYRDAKDYTVKLEPKARRVLP